jgi:two-component system cell cycle response regulator CpdR
MASWPVLLTTHFLLTSKFVFVENGHTMVSYTSTKMPEPGKQGWQILVVDDEPAVCDAIKMMLKFDGHAVQTANGSKEALTLLEQSRFDLITMDYAMPGMKGDELAAVIKQRLPHQPIIMITAYAEMLKSSGNPLPGVDFIISKPFLLADLREAITKVLPES